MSKKDEALKLALDYIVATNKSSQFWLVPESNLNRTVTAIREALAEQPAPPPECQTEAEKTAFAFGWWKALEQKRKIDSALDRMADNAKELGLDYEPIVEQVENSVGMGHKAWDMVEPKELAKAFHEALAEQPAQQQKEGFASPGGGYVPAIPRPIPLDWKLVPRKATPEMLRAMDECAQEGYDERLYEGMASSVYMAAWDASPVLGTLPPSEKERSMMDIIVGNLVREGINKHRARELAEHFVKHTSPQPSKPWVGLTEEEAEDIWNRYCDEMGAASINDAPDIARDIESALRSKNT